MAEILSGKPVAEAIREDLKGRIEALRQKGVEPGLVMLRLGAEADDVSYERSLRRLLEGLGLTLRLKELPREASQAELLEEIYKINQDDSVHGCILMRPLPAQVDSETVCAALDPKKDLDGVTGASLAHVMGGCGCGFAPCTAEACIALLDYYGIGLKGERVAVLGRSLAVGRSLSLLLQDRDATVTMCHSKTVDLPSVCRENRILCVAVGRAGLVDEGYIAPHHVIVDVGINVNEEGKLCGDVKREAAETAAAFSPVPGGVGSITVSILARHLIEAAERRSRER